MKDSPPLLSRKTLSLAHRGAWGQVMVAAILITILPTLILVWGLTGGTILTTAAIWGLAAVIVLLVSLGYVLLLKYPVSVVRLRRYLGTLADGGIPDQVNLTEDEDDLAAVQRHMERLVALTEDRIHMLEQRHVAELEVARQRVMVESMGAMCHHLGQPATVLSMCLYRLKKTPQDAPAILRDAEDAIDAMSRLLDELRSLTHYTAEPYLQSSPDAREENGARIIKV